MEEADAMKSPVVASEGRRRTVCCYRFKMNWPAGMTNVGTARALSLFLMAIAVQFHDAVGAQEETVQVTRQADREIVVTRLFSAPPEAVFDALTQERHIPHWMKPKNMSFVTCEVELRPGGSFRYVFERDGGARIAVLGGYESVAAPHRLVYTESYDFSPLELRVTIELSQAGGGTRFQQTIRYSSRKERDADFDPVATSASEIYAKLDRYLRSQ